MNKILTISVAAYNMENFIIRALESLIDERIIDDLEIFILDDGGSDRTLELAKSYAAQYPNSIFPIHKENGGYGSTVNYSIRHATGKYFKLLDGDDWFDKNGLLRLVTTLKEVDADVILTNYCIGSCMDDLEYRVITQIKEQKLIDIRNLDYQEFYPNVTLTFKMDLIRQADFQLPERMFYTDSIYSMLPFAYARTLYYLNCNVYCYWFGRGGQSMNKSSIPKHIDDHLYVCREICELFENRKKDSTGINASYMLHCALATCRLTFMWFIKYIPLSQETKGKFLDQEKNLKKLSPEIYNKLINSGKIGFLWWIIRKTHYWLYTPIMGFLKICHKLSNVSET